MLKDQDLGLLITENAVDRVEWAYLSEVLTRFAAGQCFKGKIHAFPRNAISKVKSSRNYSFTFSLGNLYGCLLLLVFFHVNPSSLLHHSYNLNVR